VLGTSNLLLNVLVTICLVVGIFSLPVCISFAILKYHLYDIDRLISRTVSYTLVTGILAGVYAGIVTFATRVLPFHYPGRRRRLYLGGGRAVYPLRRRVQHVVDRRFNRARYDADRTVAAFASRPFVRCRETGVPGPAKTLDWRAPAAGGHHRGTVEPSLLVAEADLALVDDLGRLADGGDAVADLLPGPAPELGVG
jgi:hypothetical protein